MSETPSGSVQRSGTRRGRMPGWGKSVGKSPRDGTQHPGARSQRL